MTSRHPHPYSQHFPRAPMNSSDYDYWRDQQQPNNQPMATVNVARDSPEFRSVQRVLNIRANPATASTSKKRSDRDAAEERRKHVPEAKDRNLESVAASLNEIRLSAADSETTATPKRRSLTPVGSQRNNSMRKAIQRLLQNPELSTYHIVEQLRVMCVDFGDDASLWNLLVERNLLNLAVDDGDVYVELFAAAAHALIRYKAYQDAAYSALMTFYASLLEENSQEIQCSAVQEKRMAHFCRTLGRTLVVKWPREFNSCAKENNSIIYLIISLIEQWISALSMGGSEPVVEDAYCRCLVEVVEAAGRSLWLNWPETVDHLWQLLRPAIVADNIHAHTKTRYRMLDLYVKLNEWPKQNTTRRNNFR